MSLNWLLKQRFSGLAVTSLCYPLSTRLTACGSISNLQETQHLPRHRIGIQFRIQINRAHVKGASVQAMEYLIKRYPLIAVSVFLS